VIVLHEMRVDAEAAHLDLVETFKKKAPIVAVDNRLDNQGAWYPRRHSVHEL
jgi:hypothetical protein